MGLIRTTVAVAALTVPVMVAGASSTSAATGPTVANTAITFSDTTVGTTSTMPVRVYNYTGMPLLIDTAGVSPTGGPFTVDDQCDGMNVADGDHCEIRYTFAPTELGAFLGTAPLEVNGQPHPVAMGGRSVAANGTISGDITLVNAAPGAQHNVYVTSLDGSTTHQFHNVASPYSVAVPPGEYCVSFGIGPWDGTLVSYPGKRHCLDDISPVVVTSGVATTGIDATLTLASISGTIRDEGGALLPDYYVYADLAGSAASPYDQSDAAGVYTLVNLAPGTYCVGTDTTDAASGPCRTGTRRVEVAAGANVTGVDIRLDASEPEPGERGAISGTITDAASVAQPDREIVAERLDEFGWNGYAVSAPDGTYTIDDLPPGDYCVYVRDDGSLLAGEYYENQTSCDAATPVSVDATATTTIDFELAPGATLSGQIRRPNDTPAPSARVWVRLESTFGAIEATTDASGNYTVTGLTPGDYCVLARDQFGSHPTTAYGAGGTCAQATPVSVDAGGAVTGIDIRLATGGTIAGTVTFPPGFVPGSGDGTLLISTRNLDGAQSNYVDVDVSGNYSTEPLAPGLYCMSVRPPAPSMLVRTTLGSVDPDTCRAGTIEVIDGETTELDFELELGGSISGWVITPNGFPHNDASPVLEPASGENDRVRPDGSFFVTGVAPGSYCVSIYGHGLWVLGETYEEQLHCDGGFTPVTVTAGANTGNINFFLGAASAVTGTVTRQSGPGLDQVELHRLDAAQTVLTTTTYPVSPTEAQYEIDVPPGTYCVLVRPHQSTGNANTAYGGTPDCQGAEPVVVPEMALVQDVDIALTPQIYVPLDNPARVADTRPGRPVAPGAPAGDGPVAAGTFLEVQVAGIAGVPDDAASVALNLTAVAPQGPGHMTAYPCGEQAPTASNVNYNTGETRPNSVIVRVGVDGKICIRTHATADVIVDLAGYFPAANGLVPLDNPARVIDTRPGRPVVEGAPAGAGPVAGGTTLEVQITGLAGIPADAASVAMNLTAVGAQGPGHLAAFPCGQAVPTTSNVNYNTGDTSPNAVVSKIGADGKVCIFTHATTDVIVDVAGYFVAGSGFTPLGAPIRLMDSRPDRSTVDGSAAAVGPVAGGTTYELQVGGRGGLPSGAASVMLNVTALLGEGPGHLTLFPCGQEVPTASNVNYLAGQTIPNAVIAKLGEDGKVCIRAHATTDVIVDAFGIFPAGDGPLIEGFDI